jgi:hypothetical protein
VENIPLSDVLIITTLALIAAIGIWREALARAITLMLFLIFIMDVVALEILSFVLKDKAMLAIANLLVPIIIFLIWNKWLCKRFIDYTQKWK